MENKSQGALAADNETIASVRTNLTQALDLLCKMDNHITDHGGDDDEYGRRELAPIRSAKLHLRRAIAKLGAATATGLLLCGLLASQDATPTSRIVIYQTNIRGLRGNPIFCDGAQVATLRNRWTYFVLQVPPGEHSFRGRDKGQTLILDAAPGRDYFLRMDQMLSSLGGEKLTRESAAEGRATADLITSGKLRPINPDDIRDRAKVILTFQEKAQ